MRVIRYVTGILDAHRHQLRIEKIIIRELQV
jgi:hypothetical protein